MELYRPGAVVSHRYRILSMLGQGGMGAVFRAFDRLTAQEVALKSVRPPDRSRSSLVPLGLVGAAAPRPGPDDLARAAALAATAPFSRPPQEPTAPASVVEALARTAPRAEAYHGSVLPVPPSPGTADTTALRLALAHEFQTLASVRHAHIVSVLDYGFDAGQPFFTMELLRAPAGLLPATRDLDIPTRVQLLVQVAQGLMYLHRRGILHRDLKPSNLLVVPGADGRKAAAVKLIDFGIAALRRGRHPAAEEVAGTLAYMAPEVLLGAPVSEASDLYALGVVAYEVLSGGLHPLGAAADGAAHELLHAALSAGAPHQPLQVPPRLDALVRRLLAQDPQVRPQGAGEVASELARAAGLPPPAETAAQRESFLQAARFLGREVEMQELLSALRGTLQGRGKMVLIGGESGVGKSRLLDELRTQALVRGARVLRGQAVREGGGAFQLLREVLAPLCLEVEVEPLTASVLLPLVPRLPVLLERAVRTAPPLDPKASEARALGVIEQLIAQAVEPPIVVPGEPAPEEPRPLLLLLEDLQWAGPESLLLLNRLTGLSARCRLLLVCTYRDDERPELPSQLPDAELLKLRRLDREGVSELAETMLGAPGQAAPLVDLLQRESEGNPLFLIEVVRALAEEAGALMAVGSHGVPERVLAGGVQAVLERRIERVPAWARPLLERAAVAGRQLDLPALLRTGAASELAGAGQSLDSWLLACMDRAVLEIREERWLFSHDKLRERLLERLRAAGRLPSLHRELAHAIEAAYSGGELDARQALLAYNYGAAGDPERAARCGLRAGELALKNGALAEAAVLLRETLRQQAAARVTRLDEVRARRLLAMALWGLGQVSECLAAVADAFALAGHPFPSGPGGAEGRSVLRSIADSGRFLILRRVFSAELAPRLSIDEVHELELVALHCGDLVLRMSGAPIGAAAGLRVFALAQQAGSRDADAFFAAARRYVIGLLPIGPLQRTASLRLPRRDQVQPEVYAFYLRVYTAVKSGSAHFAEVLATCDEELEHAEQSGDAHALLHHLSFAAGVRIHMGRLAEARPLAERFERLSRRHKNQRYLNVSQLLLSRLDTLDGKPSEALARTASILAHAQEIGDAAVRLAGLGLAALAHLLAEERAAAAASAEEAVALAGRRFPSASVSSYGYLLPPFVLCELLRTTPAGHPERARLQEAASRAVPMAHRFAWIFPFGAPRAALCSGLLAEARGACRRARAWTELAQWLARYLSMPIEEAEAHAALHRLSERRN